MTQVQDEAVLSARDFLADRLTADNASGFAIHECHLLLDSILDDSRPLFEPDITMYYVNIVCECVELVQSPTPEIAKRLAEVRMRANGNRQIG